MHIVFVRVYNCAKVARKIKTFAQTGKIKAIQSGVSVASERNKYYLRIRKAKRSDETTKQERTDRLSCGDNHGYQLWLEPSLWYASYE